MSRVLIDSDKEAHVMAVAEALFDHEPRNREARFSEATRQTQDRYTDKAAWALSQASKALLDV